MKFSAKISGRKTSPGEKPRTLGSHTELAPLSASSVKLYWMFRQQFAGLLVASHAHPLPAEQRAGITKREDYTYSRTHY